MFGYYIFLLPLHSQSPDGEMVDALVSGASVERRVGSSPILGTRSSSELLFFEPRIGLDNRWRCGSVVCACRMCRVAAQLWNIGREIFGQTSLATTLNRSSQPSVFLHILFACTTQTCCGRSSPVRK